MRAQRILVLWADPASPNHGVSLLARGLIKGLGDDADCTFASHRIPLAGRALSLKALLWATLSKRSVLSRAISEFDMVIDIGEGDSFASIYGWKRFGKMAFSKLAAIRAGVPLVLAPQTLGPWQSRSSRTLARVVLKRATSVWARDSASLARADALVGAGSTKRAHDLSFGLADDPPIAPNRFAKRRVLVNVSGLLWHPNPHVDSEFYRRVVRSLVQRAKAEGFDVAFFPHVFAPGSPDDDVEVSRELADEFSAPLELHKDVHLARNAIVGSDIVIASRMHACLTALTKGVPCIALAYSDKFGPLFGDVDYPYHCDLRTEGEEHVLTQVGMWLRQEPKELVSQAAASRQQGVVLLGEFLDSVRPCHDVPRS